MTTQTTKCSEDYWNEFNDDEQHLSSSTAAEWNRDSETKELS
jgi:hypothetical protein